MNRRETSPVRKIPIQCRIPVDLDKRFRLKIAEKYGVRRGALEKALTEAIILWLKFHEKGGENERI
ncbi:MAG: hypothetical protein DRJ52_02595 [Thermoprotei archaeon]|nr:MAG: hypothetical protein DRJ52_02595 [Thermoprotei archaeon]RLE99270.1 MAG: hypothetical protein DRJ63_05885 [Thermoprotei archaeon]